MEWVFYDLNVIFLQMSFFKFYILMNVLKRIYLLVLIVVVSGFDAPERGLKITYLANCGYLYECDKSKVVIDPFGTEYGSFFFLPSDETRDRIVWGKPPFDKIDLLLITHIHGDHFNARLAENFLLNNRDAKMICPPQVYRQMQDSCKSFAKVKLQIVCPELAMGELKQMRIKGVRVSAVRMQHGTSRSLEGVSYKDYTEYEKTENYGYLIRFEDKTLFHQGDGCLKINEKALQRIKCRVDIAHLSYFDWDSTSLALVHRYLGAKKVVFMHGTKPAKELKSEEFKKIAPELVFFKEEMESRDF